MKLKIGYPKKNQYGWLEWSLIISGKRFGRGHGYVSEMSNRYYAVIDSSELRECLLDFPLKTLGEQISDYTFSMGEVAASVYLKCGIQFLPVGVSEAGVEFEITFDLEEWRYPWSMSDYVREFITVAEKNSQGRWRVKMTDESPANGVSVKLPLPDDTVCLRRIVEDLSGYAKMLMDKTRIQLLLKSRSDSFVSLFEFPAEHQAVCVQYLVYFSEFMRSLGVAADTEIAEEAKQILFTVTPRQGTVALHKLQAALAVYLKLPEGEVPKSAMVHPLKEIRQLAANIRYLQKSVLEALPDLTESVVEVATQGSKLEKADFWGGRVRLKKWSKGPVELDLPRIFLDLKKRFPVLRHLE